MLEYFFRRAQTKDESGFTLIEIIVVVVIIGILSAAATPIYNGAKRHAVEAALKADVRNAAMEMEKQAIFSYNGYAPQLPDTFFESTGNVVVIDADSSSTTAFCIIGTHPNYEDMFIYYHSDVRSISEDQAICGFTNPEDYGPLPISPDDVQNPGEAMPPANPTPTPTPTPTPEPTSTTDPSSSAPADGEESNGGGDTNPPASTTPTPTPAPTTAPAYTPAAPHDYDNPKRKKYVICHKPGNRLELPLPAILNGHSKGHKDDIVPPIPGVFTGQNWTTSGAAIWYNNCKGL